VYAWFGADFSKGTAFVSVSVNEMGTCIALILLPWSITADNYFCPNHVKVSDTQNLSGSMSSVQCLVL
jgi:hypothetical protein